MEYNEKLAMSQGWLLANNEGVVEIQRHDESAVFESDEHAQLFVEDLALSGDAHARWCLEQTCPDGVPLAARKMWS